ncbi:MAG: helix-turn-helix domain-containing protein [Butyricicoccus sp.]|jgi:transcriptional regulator with XRE-family HTH domain|nr:helix-turn-helix domain-containing protein [Clostridiales bacterium]
MTGERIRGLRKQAGLKQSELAAQLGVSTSAVGMYENNRRVPPRPVLLRLCSIFHVTADYLLAEEEVSADLEQELDALKQKLMRQDGLLFHGKPVSAEDLEKVFDAARLGAELILSEEGKKYERG